MDFSEQDVDFWISIKVEVDLSIARFYLDSISIVTRVFLLFGLLYLIATIKHLDYVDRQLTVIATGLKMDKHIIICIVK